MVSSNEEGCEYRALLMLVSCSCLLVSFTNETKDRSQREPGVFMVYEMEKGQMLAQRKANKEKKIITLASF